MDPILVRYMVAHVRLHTSAPIPSDRAALELFALLPAPEVSYPEWRKLCGYDASEASAEQPAGEPSDLEKAKQNSVAMAALQLAFPGAVKIEKAS